MALRRSLVVLPLLVAGCGAHERVVAWRGGLAPVVAPQRAPVPALPRHARFCGGRSVQFLATGSQGVNSALDLHWFEVRNRGRRTCALRGRPEVMVLRAGGRPVRITQISGAFGDAIVSERTFGLRPGHRASLALFVGSACREPSLRRSRALIALRAAEHDVRLPLTTCAPGLSLSLTPFQPAEPSPAETSAPFPLSVSIVGLPHAHRGTTLVYRVRLRNDSSRPFRFSWCPTVTQWIGGQNGPVFGLNCRPAGTVAPHESVLFVMHYELSPYYRPGTRTLHWTLSDQAGRKFAGSKTTLRIEP